MPRIPRVSQLSTISTCDIGAEQRNSVWLGNRCDSGFDGESANVETRIRIDHIETNVRLVPDDQVVERVVGDATIVPLGSPRTEIASC